MYATKKYYVGIKVVLFFINHDKYHWMVIMQLTLISHYAKYVFESDVTSEKPFKMFKNIVISCYRSRNYYNEYVN